MNCDKIKDLSASEEKRKGGDKGLISTTYVATLCRHVKWDKDPGADIFCIEEITAKFMANDKNKQGIYSPASLVDWATNKYRTATGPSTGQLPSSTCNGYHFHVNPEPRNRIIFKGKVSFYWSR